MHHLILVRAVNPEISGSSGCCCRLSRDDLRWRDDAEAPPEPDPEAVRFGELYRALRRMFGAHLRITVLDPRNVFAFVPLVASDAYRHRVPLWEALRAVTSTSFATAVLDGRLLYSGVAPPDAEVLERVAARLAHAAVAAR